MIPRIVRVDRGTETDTMTTVHCYLHQLSGTFDSVDELIQHCVMYGPSTANKIERWWRELHHRMESYFKEQLSDLLNNGQYDQTNQRGRLNCKICFLSMISLDCKLLSTSSLKF